MDNIKPLGETPMNSDDLWVKAHEVQRKILEEDGKHVTLEECLQVIGIMMDDHPELFISNG